MPIPMLSCTGPKVVPITLSRTTLPIGRLGDRHSHKLFATGASPSQVGTLHSMRKDVPILVRFHAEEWLPSIPRLRRLPEADSTGPLRIFRVASAAVRGGSIQLQPLLALTTSQLKIRMVRRWLS